MIFMSIFNARIVLGGRSPVIGDDTVGDAAWLLVGVADCWVASTRSGDSNARATMGAVGHAYGETM